MALYTLEQAQAHLQAWLDADLALATSESIRFGKDGQMLTRANAKQVQERIAYWSKIVQSLQRGGRGRFIRCTPLDT